MPTFWPTVGGGQKVGVGREGVPHMQVLRPVPAEAASGDRGSWPRLSARDHDEHDLQKGSTVGSPFSDRSTTEKVDRQLMEVGDRLCREFADEEGPTSESIRAQVRDARADFGSPKVITYLPVLVERAVRDDLTGSRAPSTDLRGHR